MLSLYFCFRGFYLLHLRRYLAIEDSKIYTLQIFNQFSRLFNIVERTNIYSLLDVFNCLFVWRVVHELVKCIYHIVFLKLIAFSSVVRNVAGKIMRIFKAVRSMHFNQLYFAVEVNPKQLSSTT